MQSFVFNDSAQGARLFGLKEFGNIYSRIMNVSSLTSTSFLPTYTPGKEVAPKRLSGCRGPRKCRPHFPIRTQNATALFQEMNIADSSFLSQQLMFSKSESQHLRVELQPLQPVRVSQPNL
jgi:hypothetical protein